MKQAGSSPRVTTSVRQLCTAKSECGMSPNMRVSAAGVIGHVRSQGGQNTAQTVAVVVVGILGEGPAREWKRLPSGGTARTLRLGPSRSSAW